MRWRTAHRRAVRQRRKAVLVAALASRIYEALEDGLRLRGGRLLRKDAYDDIMATLDFDTTMHRLAPYASIDHDRFTIDTGERRYQFFVTVASGTDASWVREHFERELREAMEVPLEFLITNDPINPTRYRKD